MNRKGIRSIALLIALVLTLLSSVTALAETEAIVLQDTRIYAAPTTRSQSATLRQGWKVNILETGNGAAKVEINGVMGYTYLGALAQLDENGAAKDGTVFKTITVEVAIDNLPVYNNFSTAAKKICTLPKGTQITCHAYNSIWAILESNGVYGACLSAGLKLPGTDAGAQEEQTGGQTEDEAVFKTFTVEVATDNLPVYNNFSTGAKMICTLPKGTQITCHAYNSTWAVLENNGIYGACLVSGLKLPEENSGAQEGQNGAQSGGEAVYKTFTVEVATDNLPVYNNFSLNAKQICTLPKGTQITCRAYNSTWAVLESNGIYGACLVSGLTLPSQSQQTPDAEPETPQEDSSSQGNSSTVTLAGMIASGKYSNEEIIYYFLTQEMKLNTAAACGILANIKNESSFRPTAYNSNGGSYGICQWTGSRYTRLKNFCSDYGYDYKTLEAQLWFLEYELENHYTKTLKYMRAVENTASGAYDAGYYWCYNFEVPANRSSVSVKRGNLAKDTYWEKYA